MSKQVRVEPRRLKGFRDFLPEQMAKRLALIDVIRREAGLAGFSTIGTPALEYAETLLGHGEETDKQVYRFRDHGDRDVALRFDLTVPFARFVAEHQGQLVFPFKKLQMGDVWRGENTQKGRYREFGQCDLDIIGVDSLAADVEILSVFKSILTSMNCGPFTISVGHRAVLTGLLRRMIPQIDAPNETRALIAIDKLAKVGADSVCALLAEISGSSVQAATEILDAITRKTAAGDTDLDMLASAFTGWPSAAAITPEIQRLRDVVTIVRSLHQGPGNAVIDLSIARGLGYYTGVVFETVLDAAPGFGSIGSGGRYNQLAARFTTRDLPGVGGSIGLDRLLAALEDLGQVATQDRQLVFVAVATDDARAYAFEIADILRRHGIATDIGMVAKLGNQFKHADRLGCAMVVTVGSDEQERRTYALKYMRENREQRDLPLTGLVDTILGDGR